MVTTWLADLLTKWLTEWMIDCAEIYVHVFQSLSLFIQSIVSSGKKKKKKPVLVANYESSDSEPLPVKSSRKRKDVVVSLCFDVKTEWVTGLSTDWLTYLSNWCSWPTDWLAVSLTDAADWLTGCLTDWRSWLTGCLTDWRSWLTQPTGVADWCNWRKRLTQLTGVADAADWRSWLM